MSFPEHIILKDLLHEVPCPGAVLGVLCGLTKAHGTSAKRSWSDGQYQWLINQLVFDSNGITPLESQIMVC